MMTASYRSATQPPAEPSYFAISKKQRSEFLSIAKRERLIYTRAMDDTKHYPGRLRAPPGEAETPPSRGAPTAEAPAAIRYLGPEIRNLRKARGMTLAAVAAASGLSVGYLSLLERDRATPSINALHAISRALGVTISWFFEAGETPAPERDI